MFFAGGKYFCVGLTLLMSGIWCSCRGHAAEVACAKNLNPTEDTNVVYRQRGGWCEGVFSRPVAAAVNLSIIGAHLSKPSLPAAPGSIVQVRVSDRAPPGPLSLRIVSTKPRQYYRLDALVSPRQPFAWPSEVRSHEKVMLSSGHVRGLACQGSCDARSPTVIPIGIGDAGGATRSVNLSFQAAVDLKQVYVTAKRSDGTAVYSDAPLFSSNPVQLANTAFETGEITNLSPGKYGFKITAVPRSGDALDVLRFTLIVP